MKVLVPFDASDVSDRALEFAAELVRRYEGTIHAVHVTDVQGPETEEILSSATEIIEAEGLDDDPELVTDAQSSGTRFANRVGEVIVEMANEEEYDHIVMGHHGDGTVDEFVLGSAAKTVADTSEMPVTIVP